LRPSLEGYQPQVSILSPQVENSSRQYS